MKHTSKYLLLALSFLFSVATVSAQVKLKDALKAVVQVKAFDAANQLIASGNGFYVSDKGDVVCAYQVLAKADRAEVTDMKGKTFALARILGADSSNDLIRFSTAATSSTPFFRLCDAPVSQGSALQIVRFSKDKKQKPEAVTVTADAPYNLYKYYDLSVANEDRNMMCPLLDEEGTLVAMTQKNMKKDATTACAIDARFIQSLTMSSTAAIQSDLRALALPKALPEGMKEASTFLYLMNKSDTVNCLLAYDDFVAAYPSAPDAFVSRANYLASIGRFQDCEKDYAAAFRAAETAADTLMQPDAVHYALSDLIYRTIILQTDSIPVFEGWTMERALDEAGKAYALKPFTLYNYQKANCLFALRRYEEAYLGFRAVLSDSNFVSPEVYMSAIRSLERARKNDPEILVLCDSMIQSLPQPLTTKSAPYYLERARRYLAAEKFREAVFDYNEYEKIIGPRNLNEKFYYLRHQAEVKAKMYQQALDDIRTAVAIAPLPLAYRLQEALLLLRVGEFADAEKAAKELLKDLPENPDCHRIIGLCAGEQGRKQEALQHLRKAQELGDENVEAYIEKYSK